MQIPKFGEKLTDQHIQLLEAVATSCRESIIKMVTNAQSGHPGGSLSMIDYLTVIYTFLINQTNDPVIVSNGHVSPAVYSILAELGAVNKTNAVANFRKPNDVFEGHINREVNGVWFGTGPLGVGGSAATGIALATQLKHDSTKHIYLTMGDGELQEGQAYEMMNFANKYKLSNLTLFVDYNQVQLTDSLENIMPTNVQGHFEASGWEVINMDGHDYQAMWDALGKAHQSDKPVCLIGHTVMGKGISFMEITGQNHQADWHGKAPSVEMGAQAAAEVRPSSIQSELISDFLKEYPTKINTAKPGKHEAENSTAINPGTPVLYKADTFTDNRSAYGKALGDLAKLNKNIVALTADLEGSVKTGSVKETDPARHIECGIAEQHMVSCAGGMSVDDFVPFCSTFGAFMSSRAKDQARVNDINHANVKMVATHCGLSVGEDGPTHQAIDDISSFAGFFNTQIFEPADPNQTDRIIRYVATTNGNFYVRMGRAKTPTITKTDGTPFYDTNYTFTPGQADIIRAGDKLTIMTAGPMLAFALKAIAELGIDGIEVIAVSSFTPFDNQTILSSLKKTGKGITIHDHNIHTGLASYVSQALAQSQQTAQFINLGVAHYQLSGTETELYDKAGMGVEGIKRAISELL